MCPHSTERGVRTTVLAVALVLVMVTSVPVLAAGPSDGSVDAPSDILDEGLDEADAVYIDESGDAVLVYEEEEFDGDEIMIGGDVSNSVLHLFMADSLEPDEADDAELSGSIHIEDDILQADGEMLMPTPDEVKSADAFISGEISRETNELAAGLDVEFVDDSPAAMEGEFESEGEMMLSTDEFVLDASGSFSTGEPASDYPQTFHVTVDHDDDTFVGDVTQAQMVLEDQADQWDSEENVTAMLTDQFEMAAEELDGEATVTLEDHSFEEMDDGGYYVEIAYEVELHGVQEGLANELAQELAEDPDFSISDEQAQDIADALQEIELNEFEVGYTMDAMAGGSGDATVHVSGLSPVIHELLEVAEQELEDEELAEFESFKDAYIAQEEADVEHHLTWDVIADSEPHDAGTLVHLTAEVDAYSTNWDDYIDETDSDSLAGADVTFEFELEEQAGELVTTGEVTVAQEDLLQSGLDSFVGMLDEDDVDDETLSVIEAIRDSELEIAKIDYDISDGEVIVEAGAKFEDLSAAFGDDTPVPESFVMDNSDGTNTYVYIDGLVDDPSAIDATDVRALDIAGEGTDIHLPGEWDEEFPTFDVEAAGDYLDVEVTVDDDDDDDDGDGTDDDSSDDTQVDDGDDTIDATPEDDDSIPGFGPFAAALAILLGCGYRLHRR